MEPCACIPLALTALAILITNSQMGGRSALGGLTCGRYSRVQLAPGRSTGDLMLPCPAPAAALTSPQCACVLLLRGCKLLLSGCVCLLQLRACLLLLLCIMRLLPACCDRCCRR